MSFDYEDEEEPTEVQLIIKLINIINFKKIYYEKDSKNKQEAKSFRERLNEIQEICLKIQEILEYVASLAERVIK